MFSLSPGHDGKLTIPPESMTGFPTWTNGDGRHRIPVRWVQLEQLEYEACLRDGDVYLDVCMSVRPIQSKGYLQPTNFHTWGTGCGGKSTKNTNKQQKQKANKKGNAKVGQKKTNSSLGRTLLKGGLGMLGGLLGPTGANVGASLGDWGANILGMGDYKVEHNSLSEGQGVPSMHKDGKAVRIKHREFLGDITGSTGFTSKSFVIQPGSSTTFPWLSNIAGMFQQYKIHGCAFEFVSTSANALNSVNTALGTVIMATQYNVAFPDFVNKAEMDQYEYTCSSRPSSSLLHLIECAPHLQVMDHLFLRTGSLPAGQDYQFYDWGKFQIATVGMQAAATIGELWVTYDIEFLKPRIASGGCWPGDFTRISNGPWDANNPLGIVQTTPVGNLGASITAGATGFQRIYLPNTVTAGRFYVFVRWSGAATAAVVLPTRTYSNMAVQNGNFNLGGAGEVQSPVDTTVSARITFSGIYTVSGYDVNGSYINLSAGTLPGTPANVDVLIVALPLSDTPF